MDLMSSVLKSNGVFVLRAVTYCWAGRKRRSSSVGIPRDHLSEIQALIEILIHLNDYTITDMILHMNELIRDQSANNERVGVQRKGESDSPPVILHFQSRENHTVGCFQFLLAYCEQQPKFSMDCWSSLAAMFKECLAQPISSTVTFLMIRFEEDTLPKTQSYFLMLVEYGVFTSSKPFLSLKNEISTMFKYVFTRPLFP